MGTRADFYVGRGPSAEWLGSIAWDGYPDGLTPDSSDTDQRNAIVTATTEPDYRAALAVMAASREDWTGPERGWPWPWESSASTDYAYAFDDGAVWASHFGREWFRASEPEPEGDLSPRRTSEFPLMATDDAAAPGDTRSGLIVVRL